MTLQSIKLGALALLTSVCGFATAPAFAQNAASIVQTSDQTATQIGSGNVSVQGNVQTGIVTQMGTPYAVCVTAPCPAQGGINGATVLQTNQQDALQQGVGNTSIQGNSSTAAVLQGTGFPSYPGYPSIIYPPMHSATVEGATVLQHNQQTAGQLGYGNSSAQGNEAATIVGQH